MKLIDFVKAFKMGSGPMNNAAGAVGMAPPGMRRDITSQQPPEQIPWSGTPPWMQNPPPGHMIGQGDPRAQGPSMFTGQTPGTPGNWQWDGTKWVNGSPRFQGPPVGTGSRGRGY